MLLKENPFFKIKQPSGYDRQYNGNKITHLFFLRGPIPNDPVVGNTDIDDKSLLRHVFGLSVCQSGYCPQLHCLVQIYSPPA